MATISTLLKPAHGNSPRGRTPYYVDMSIDLTAQAISCTGGDVVQCLTIPANTRVLHAGFQVVESATMNTGTNATAILGAADDNEFVAAFDIDGAADGAYAPSATPAADVTLATAEQINKTETYRDPDSFADIVRGMHLYGRKILRPEALVNARFCLV